jgi:hypothetical protein
MKRLIGVLALAGIVAGMVLAGACAPVYSPSAYQGGAAGMAVGATAGALLDSQNAWRGGIIGGAVGASIGATLGEISDQAARQAAMQQRQVVYRNMAGNTKVVVVPSPTYGSGYYQGTPPGCVHCPPVYRPRCRMVTQQVWRNGYLVQTIRRRICM